MKSNNLRNNSLLELKKDSTVRYSNEAVWVTIYLQIFWNLFYAISEMNSHYQYLKPKSDEKQLRIVHTVSVRKRLLKLD